MQASGLTEFIPVTCTSAMGDGGLGGEGGGCVSLFTLHSPSSSAIKGGLGVATSSGLQLGIHIWRPEIADGCDT